MLLAIFIAFVVSAMFALITAGWFRLLIRVQPGPSQPDRRRVAPSNLVPIDSSPAFPTNPSPRFGHRR